tara:strand:- start:94 stop:507 length:414 start_codon:yes stop_codon:yes gene_type:complete
MENNKLVFHMPKENKEDFQTIMDDIDMEKLYKFERNRKIKDYLKGKADSDSGILNNIDFDNNPKKFIYLNHMAYAFVYINSDFALWAKRVTQNMGTKDFTEVSSLLDVPVFTYQELKKHAVAIGWIDEDNHNWLIER